MRVGLPRPVGKQLHRLRTGRLRRVTKARQSQRTQPVPHLPGHGQGLPAGRQHPHIITSTQQPSAQPRSRTNHMLAVVQHQQQLLAGQHSRHCIGHWHAGLLPHPQRCRHNRLHPRWIPYRGQLCQPRPVGKPARHSPGHLTGQPGLPRTARPGHRHQPALIQQPRHLAHRPGTADKARQHSRKTVHITRGSHPSPLHARTITTYFHRRIPQPDLPAETSRRTMGRRQNRCGHLLVASLKDTGGRWLPPQQRSRFSTASISGCT